MKNRIPSLIFFILGAALTSVVFTFCETDDIQPTILEANLYPTADNSGALGFKYNELVNYNLLQHLDFAITENKTYFDASLNEEMTTTRNSLGEIAAKFGGVRPLPPIPLPPSPCDRGVCIFLNLQDQLILTDMPAAAGTALLLSPDGQIINEGSIDGGTLYMGQASQNFQDYTGDAHLVIMTYEDGANGFENTQAITLHSYIEQ